MLLSDFTTLTFDCYGTLIDWESGMVAGLRPLAERAARPLRRNDILEAHARAESRLQAEAPATLYRDLLALVYERVAEAWGVAAPRAECRAYARSVADWPAFPDSAEALAYLKRHFKLAILSNVDNESFAHSNKRLGVAFDAVYTAEDIGSYKPDDRNFAYMLEALARLGVQKSEILHTAESVFHDHVPAARCGLASCWIYRRHNQDGFGATMPPKTPPPYNFRFNSMSALATAHATTAQP